MKRQILIPALLFILTFGLGLQSAYSQLSSSGGAWGIGRIGAPALGPPPTTITLLPSSLAFGSVSQNVSSSPQSVTLTNTGGATLTITSIVASSDYGTTDDCGGSVLEGSACVINVTFTPTIVGADNGTLTVTDNATGSPHTVTLTGTGLAVPTYAVWTGIDALSTGALSAGRIGTTEWGVTLDANTTASVVDSSDSVCSTALVKAFGAAGTHKCILFSRLTSTGTAGFPGYLYLNPSWGLWDTTANKNPCSINGTVSTGGCWFQFTITNDVNSRTYLGNTGAQVKYQVMRNNAGSGGSYGNLNNNVNPNYGHLQFYTSPNSGSNGVGFQDDGTTGTVINEAAPGLSAAETIYCQVRRNTSTNLGVAKCSVNGVEEFNHSTGFSQMGSSNTGSTWKFDFELGMRYFQICSNSCANTTLKVYITGVSVGDSDFGDYP